MPHRALEHVEVEVAVRDLPRLVNRLVGASDISDVRLIFPVRKDYRLARPRDLPPGLRGVVLVGEPALRQRLDLQGVGLGVRPCECARRLRV